MINTIENYGVVHEQGEGESFVEGVNTHETQFAWAWTIKQGDTVLIAWFYKDESRENRLEVCRAGNPNFDMADWENAPVKDYWHLEVEEIHEKLLELETIKQS